MVNGLVDKNDKLTEKVFDPLTSQEPSRPKNNELQIYPSTVEASLLPSALYFGGDGMGAPTTTIFATD